MYYIPSTLVYKRPILIRDSVAMTVEKVKERITLIKDKVNQEIR